MILLYDKIFKPSAKTDINYKSRAQSGLAKSFAKN
jgi:hypothetical protein